MMLPTLFSSVDPNFLKVQLNLNNIWQDILESFLFSSLFFYWGNYGKMVFQLPEQRDREVFILLTVDNSVLRLIENTLIR